MNSSNKENPWVWVVVQDPEGDNQFLGQHDEEKDINFIPFFSEKDDAIQCQPNLRRIPGQKYEVQAIQYSDLAEHAYKNEFLLFSLDGTGKVLDIVQPSY